MNKKIKVIISIIFIFSISGKIFASETEIKEEEKEVAISDIQIGSYEKEMVEGESQTLTVTIIPEERSDATISYTSSDENVLKVSSQGEVEALAKGSAVLTIKAGEIKKEIEISVRRKTTSINLNEAYLILKPSQTFTIIASVLPEDSQQSFSYKSLNADIASVSDQGIIKGIKAGTTSIIVSNKDQTSVVTVIVNETSSFSERVELEGRNRQDLLQSEATINPLLALVKNSSDLLCVSGQEYSFLDKEILKELYESGKDIKLEYELYSIIIKGKDINNYNNTFQGNIAFVRTRDGIRFTLNEGNKLPSELVLECCDEVQGKYLYLYNKDKDKYQRLEMKEAKGLVLDEGGTYLFSEKKINSMKFSFIYIIGGLVILLILAGIYVGVKKKYWFW